MHLASLARHIIAIFSSALLPSDGATCGSNELHQVNSSTLLNTSLPKFFNIKHKTNLTSSGPAVPYFDSRAILTYDMTQGEL